MKRFINVMTIGSAVITSIFIILTILTSHQFIYVGQLFYSYVPIQVGLAITMAFLAIRFWLYEHGMRKFGYSALSLSITVILLLSINIVR